MTTSRSDAWVTEVEAEMGAFAMYHGIAYSATPRELSASFEIGCFHAVTKFYSATCQMGLANLQHGQFRYLTSPNGNPANFSYLTFAHAQSGVRFELRQQVRVTSAVDPTIAFTPDLVVIPDAASITGEVDELYANGKRRFFSVPSDRVIAAHECKSMNPFPELLIGFLGMLITAHRWLEYPHCRDLICSNGLHLAPTLFVGGTPSMWHARMVTALATAYPINVVTGMHSGTWNLRARQVNAFDLPRSA